MELTNGREYEGDYMLGMLELFLLSIGYRARSGMASEQLGIIRDITARAYDAKVPVEMRRETITTFVRWTENVASCT